MPGGGTNWCSQAKTSVGYITDLSATCGPCRIVCPTLV